MISSGVMKQKKQECDEIKKEGETKKQKKQAHDDEKNKNQSSNHKEKSLFCFAPQKNNTPFLEYKSKCILLLLLFPLNFHLRRATLFTAVHLETGGVGIAVVVVLVGGGGAFCPLLL